VENRIIIQQVFMLFLILLVGVYSKKRQFITEEVSKKLSDLLLKVTQPLMIITSFQMDFSEDMLVSAGLVFLCSFGIHVLSILLAQVLFIRYPQSVKSVMKFAIVFSNCGFMGFPVLDSVFGSIGVFYGSIYVISFNIFVWTYGIMVFSGEKEKGSWKKVLFNPGIISVMIGLIIFLFGIKLPAPIFKAMSTVGSMTTPLSMLIVGSRLADVKIKELFKGFPVYYCSAVRLLLIPLLSLGLLKMLPIPEEVLYACTLLASMPVAANTTIFAELYGGDAAFASRCVGISTFFSVLTISLIGLLI